jgi:RNA polymerase sigma-70 factor, ECF subfamily
MGIQRSLTNAPPVSKLSELPRSLELARIHDDHADFVWRSLQRLGVRSADLEDQLQEVFIVVHRKLGSFDHSARLSTWLFGICLRVAASYRRRAHVRHEELGLETSGNIDGNAVLDPEHAFARRQAIARLERILGALGLERRAVFVMFEIEGIPAGTIAETLGVPVGTVYSRLSTARAEFTRALERLERSAPRGTR